LTKIYKALKQNRTRY